MALSQALMWGSAAANTGMGFFDFLRQNALAEQKNRLAAEGRGELSELAKGMYDTEKGRAESTYGDFGREAAKGFKRTAGDLGKRSAARFGTGSLFKADPANSRGLKWQREEGANYLDTTKQREHQNLATTLEEINASEAAALAQIDEGLKFSSEEYQDLVNRSTQELTDLKAYQQDALTEIRSMNADRIAAVQQDIARTVLTNVGGVNAEATAAEAAITQKWANADMSKPENVQRMNAELQQVRATKQAAVRNVTLETQTAFTKLEDEARGGATNAITSAHTTFSTNIAGLAGETAYAQSIAFQSALDAQTKLIGQATDVRMDTMGLRANTRAIANQTIGAAETSVYNVIVDQYATDEAAVQSLWDAHSAAITDYNVQITNRIATRATMLANADANYATLQGQAAMSKINAQFQFVAMSPITQNLFRDAQAINDSRLRGAENDTTRAGQNKALWGLAPSVNLTGAPADFGLPF